MASGSTLQIVNVLGCGLSGIVVSLRVYVRVVIVKKLAIDDYCMIVSVLAAIAAAGMIGASVTYGLGDPKPSLLAAKLSFLCGFPVSICQTFGRVSFALTLLAIMGITKTRRHFLYFLIAMQFMVSFVGLVLGYGMCRPIEVIWNTSVKESERCLELFHSVVVEHWQYFQNGWNALTDFSLALFPSLIIGNLQMRRMLKLGLIGLMSLGVFAGIITIVKSIEYNVLYKDPKHSSYTQSDIFIWTVVQDYTVIIAASIPSIKPLFARSTNCDKSFGSLRGFGSLGRRLFLTNPFSKASSHSSNTTVRQDGSFVPLESRKGRGKTSIGTMDSVNGKAEDSESGKWILEEQGVPAHSIMKTTAWTIQNAKESECNRESV